MGDASWEPVAECYTECGGNISARTSRLRLPNGWLYRETRDDSRSTAVALAFVETPVPYTTMAVKALGLLSNRAGLDGWWGGLDHSTQVDIIGDLAKALEEAATNG